MYSPAASPDDRKARRSFRFNFPLSPSEGWSTVILAALLVIITVTCMENLDWTPGSSILTSTTLIGLVIGFITAKQRIVPQWLAEIPALLLGIFLAVQQSASATNGGDVRALLSHLGPWLSDATSGQASSDQSVFLLFLAVLTMLLGYVSMWLIFRSHSPWLAVVANAIVLLINLNYSGEDKIVFAVFFMFVTLLLLVRFNLVEHMRLWRSKGLRYAPEISWDFMQFGFIFAVLVMVLAAVMPSNYANTTLENLWNGSNSPWSNVQSKFAQLFNVNGNASNKTRVGFGSSLGIQANVNLPNTPVFTYTYTSPNSQVAGLADSSYLLGLTYDAFDGHSWSTGSTVTQAVASGSTIAPETQRVVQITSQIAVIIPPDGHYIYALGEPGGFDVNILAHHDGISIAGGDTVDSWTDWQLKDALAQNQTYTTTSYLSDASATDLQAVPAPKPGGDSNYSAAFLKRYTQLPQDLLTGSGDPTHEIKTTAETWVQGAQAVSMYDKIAAIISNFGKNGFRYSTQNQAPPAKEDAALALLNTKQGYCTWYATTTVMMLRELGIPSRMALGFAHGGDDSAQGDVPPVAGTPKAGPTKSDPFTVRGTDAHAWVQVYFAGFGWINFEPSIAGGAFSALPLSSQGTDTGPDKTPTTPKRTASPTPVATVTAGATTTPDNSNHSPGSHLTLTPGNVTASLVVLLLLIVGFGLGIWWLLLFRSLSPVGRTFARMTLLGRLAGVKADPSQTASEYGKLLGEQIPEQRSTIDEITKSYVRERWAPVVVAQPLPNNERWQRLRNDLLRRLPQRLRQRPGRRRL